ncbi:MAG TPA: HAD family acid phosphatase [Solirubrobacteraceae bacterium]|nr:HAD family acid phosphatase [Solirubrobacteraceae bacterium]
MPARALLAALVFVLPCASPAVAATIRTDTPGSAITSYYDSGQWSRDITTVVKKAKANLKQDLAADRATHSPALVLDVDETSAFNAPCLEPVDWDLSGLAVCAVNGDGVATPVLSLYKYARTKHVKVVFITGRPEALAGTTTAELKRLGFSSGFQLVLRPATDTQDSVIPYKSAARATVERRGYTILANVGDQRSDLAGGHSLRRYKLPNPVYLIT